MMAAPTSSPKPRPRPHHHHRRQLPVLWSSSEVTVDTSASGLRHQTPATRLRRGAWGETPVAVFAFTSAATTAHGGCLWAATLGALRQSLLDEPWHPNLAQVHGILQASRNAYDRDQLQETAHDSDREDVEEDDPAAGRAPCGLVLEWQPTSLWEVLHVEGLALAPGAIRHIAREVLLGLEGLFQRHQSLGTTLTSRRVMLTGPRGVKLRRFGTEWLRHRLPPELAAVLPPSAAATSHYRPPGEAAAAGSDPDIDSKHHHHAGQREDLYAFGVLLLEMCTGRKPDAELFNHQSVAGQLDPAFERVLRLVLGPAAAACGDPSMPTAVEPLSLLHQCLRLLVPPHAEAGDSSGPVTLDDANDDRFRSCATFASFVHADHYARSHERLAIEASARRQDLATTTSLKRLAAVEEELVEEQRSFEILVRQFEQEKLDKARVLAALDTAHGEIDKLQETLRASAAREAQAETERIQRQQQLADQQQRLDAHEAALRRAHADRQQIEQERQSLLIEILNLKDERRQLHEHQRDLEQRLAETTAKVGGERDALDELEGLWKQAIHRWEQEQRARRHVERQLEALNKQLVGLEEERGRYCASLQLAPTGPRTPQEASSLVLGLKDKEIASLEGALRARDHELSDLRRKLAAANAEIQRLRQEVVVDLESTIKDLRGQLETTRQVIDDHVRAHDETRSELARARESLERLGATCESLAQELEGAKNRVVELENAKKNRRCLTANCDAPRYLVKASGYCVECEERRAAKPSKLDPTTLMATSPLGKAAGQHRRQRSLDGAKAILNSVRNIPIIDLLKQIDVAREDDDVDARDEEEHQDVAPHSEIIALIKRLARVLKEDETLKEDLPECNALKTVLSLMDQYRRSLGVLLECLKLMSCVVFDHDRNRVIFVAEGAVEKILSAMKTFPGECRLQESAAVVLTNLSHNCESNRRRIHVAGGVEAILKAMQSFPRQRSIQMKCCWALLTFAGSDFMCDKIASLGGVGAILAAMLNCPDHDELQYYGSWAVLNLVSGATHLRDFACREGAPEVLEAAMACFPEHPGIQEKCQETLSLLGRLGHS